MGWDKVGEVGSSILMSSFLNVRPGITVSFLVKTGESGGGLPMHVLTYEDWRKTRST